MKFIAALFQSGLAALGWLTLAVGCAALLAPFHWVFALFGAWDMTIIWMCLVAAGLCALGKQAAVSCLNLIAVGLLFGLHPNLPTVRPTEALANPGERVINVLWANLHDQSDALDTLAAQQAKRANQIVALAEVPAGAPLGRLFPQTDHLGPANEHSIWGVELAGCKPVSNKELVRDDSSTSFGMKAQCDGFTLFAVHLQNPTRGQGLGLALRNEELAKLAQAVANQPGPVLVLGDFNAPPTTRPFAAFARTAKLKRVVCTSPSRGTWRPNAWRHSIIDGVPLLSVPIDHMLVRDITVTACEVGQDFGSDHYPLNMQIIAPRAFKPQSRL